MKCNIIERNRRTQHQELVLLYIYIYIYDCCGYMIPQLSERFLRPTILIVLYDGPGC